MLNFFGKSILFTPKKIIESGSKDEESIIQLNKMNNIEKGIISLKTALFNFISYSENFRKYFKDINSSINLIYKNSPYENLIEEITCKHQIIQREIEDNNKEINIVLSKVSDWSKNFDFLKVLNSQREEKKKVYEHYESKLLKIKKNNKKEPNYLERNKNKYNKADSEYKEISKKLNDVLEKSFDKAYEFTSGLFEEVMAIEKKLFEEIGKSLNCFTDLKERFNEIKKKLDNDKVISLQRKNTNYKNFNKNISLYRTMSENFINPQKNISKQKNLDISIENKKNSLLKRMSLNITQRDNNLIIGNKKENNLFPNTRITTSFGIIEEEKLVEFYSLEDEFD